MTAELEFIASVVPAGQGPAEKPPGDSDYPVRVAAAVSDAGFDKLLVGYAPRAADGLLVASLVLTTSASLGVVVTHVPGLVAPTVAARQYATLAAFHRDRVAMHVVIHDEAEEAAPGAPEGDDCDPAAKPRRAAEFLEVVRLAWSSAGAFTYSGEFYQVAGAGSATGPRAGGLPVYVSTDSAEAERFGTAHADICVLSSAPPPVLAARIGRLRAAAARQGRSPRFGVSLRLVTGAGEAPASGRSATASRLSWIPPAGPQGILAGSHDEQVRDLTSYVEAGVSTLIIGHDPETDADAAACAEIIARVRAGAFSAGARRPGRG